MNAISELMRLDEEYRSWIQELGNRYRTSQIKASIRVNNEMLMYYWSVGKDITERCSRIIQKNLFLTWIEEIDFWVYNNLKRRDFPYHKIIKQSWQRCRGGFKQWQLSQFIF